MAKQDLSRHQEGIVKRYYQNQDTIQSNKLGDLVSELWLAEDEKTKVKLWGKAQVALMRMGVQANRVAQVVGKRDLEALAKLVSQADAGTAPKTPPKPGEPGGGGDELSKPIARGAKSVADGRTIAQMKAEKAAAAGFDSLEEDNLKRALRAFRKKLKTLRRDDESKLGGRYVSQGKASSISAITPPPEFPAPVWARLVELKRLNKAGQGTFELPEDTARRGG